MIVYQLDFERMLSAPFEANSILIINSNTVLTSPISFECFKSITPEFP